MRTALVFVVVMAAACSSKKQDDCQRFVDKSKPVMEAFMKQGDKELNSSDLDKLVEKCRAEHGKPGNKDDELMACVLKADGDEAVGKCWGAALGDYRTRGKKTEAALQLNKLGKMLKMTQAETSIFPIGKAGPTPAEDCCKGPNGKCAVTDAWAKDPVWSKLEFQIDEPHLFRYTYASDDGKTATATAIGDLDCDGTPITYTLTTTIGADGIPTANITEPPANSD